MQQQGTIPAFINEINLDRISSTARIGELFVTFGYLIPYEDLTPIIQTDDAVNYLRNKCFNPLTITYREESYAIFLNQANRVIGWHCLSIGGITGTVVDPRIVISLALACGAVQIIISHNHPSGRKTPGRADEAFTQKLKNCCLFHDMRLLDHIVLTENDYFSFADNGLL